MYMWMGNQSDNTVYSKSIISLSTIFIYFKCKGLNLSLINVNRSNLYILARTVSLLTYGKDVVHVRS